MKFGVIGLGAMGKNHARIYAELGLLGAVCDLHGPTAVAAGATYGVTAFSDLDAFLRSPLGGASIAVPTPLHREVALKCFQAGLNVLLEKPMSDTLESARLIDAEAKGAGKILAVGYIERYNPAFRALQTLVDGGVFGELTSVNIRRVGGEPRSTDNIVLDLMTHDFDLLMALFGRKPEKITTHAHESGGVVNSAQALLDFGTASATCEANWISPIKIRRIQLTGTAGYCDVDLIKKEIVKIDAGFNGTDTPVKGFSTNHHQELFTFTQEPLKEQLVAFAKAVAENSSAGLVTGEDGLRVLELTLQAIREAT